MNGAKKNTRAVGSLKETEACTYLENKGYEILERNFQTKAAEIDIVAKTKDLAGTSILVFVEVKYRATDHYGEAVAAVTPVKQMKIRFAALQYLFQHDYPQDTTPIRFDVIGIDGQKITHIEEAF